MKLIHSRKGQEKMIAKLVIAAIGFVLVAFVIARIGSSIREEAGPQACLGALTAQNWMISKLSEGSSTMKPWPRVCHTKDVTIEGETAPQASQEIIRMLGDCWYQMGSGRFSPFALNLIITGRKCFICNTFRAPNLQEPITDVQFNAYLKEISHPGSDESLYETFNKDLSIDLPGDFDVENIPLLSEPITREKYYALIFLDVEDDARSGWILRNVWGESGAGAFEGRFGVSKLHISSIEQARECFGEQGADEVETGD